MHSQSMRSFKWFWPWQDREEERWLRQMSLEGWHLTSRSWPFYTFVRGEPTDYVYRLDSSTRSGRDLEDYLSFFKEAGWEYLGKLSAWHYFRQSVVDGQPSEIYTDSESKVDRYRRLLWTLLTPSPLSMVVTLAAMKKFGRHPPWLVALTVTIFVVWTAYSVAAAIMIWRRIQEAKRAQLA